MAYSAVGSDVYHLYDDCRWGKKIQVSCRIEADESKRLCARCSEIRRGVKIEPQKTGVEGKNSFIK